MDSIQNELPTGTFMTKQRFSFKVPWTLIGILAAMGAAVLVISVSVVQLLYASRIQSDVSRVRRAPVAIVLGASVKRDQTPSDALRDRILGAVDLYERGIVKRILMTGDDGAFHIDEISVMVKTATEAGVPREDIWTDGHGYRTYESCKRAIEQYHVTNAVVVTQRFHMARALFLCNQLGIDASGYLADRRSYERGAFFWIRDLASSVKAFWDVYVDEPLPPVEYAIVIEKDERH
jgi:SanA protein